MTRTTTAAAAFALALAILFGPLALARCAASCEAPKADVALTAPPCHHHNHHTTASAPVAPTVGVATVAVASSVDTLRTAEVAARSLARTPTRSSPSFVMPLRI